MSKRTRDFADNQAEIDKVTKEISDAQAQVRKAEAAVEQATQDRNEVMATHREIAKKLKRADLSEQERAALVAEEQLLVADLTVAKEDMERLRRRAEQLRRNEEQLRRNLEQLCRMKEQLREEKLQQNGTAVAPGGACDDRSSEVALAMLVGDPRAPPPATAADLQDWLEQPLGRPLPLHPIAYNRLRYDSDSHRVLHLVEATPEAYTLSATVFTALSLGPSGESEISLAMNMGLLIDVLFTRLQALTGLLPHRMDYHVSGRSGVTHELLLPNFCLWVDDTLVFKGEIKARSSDMRLAVDKLGSKMGHVWSPIAFGNLPYLLCYATAGPQLQFYAVLKSQPQQPVSISKRFDLSVVADRVEVVHHMANLFRLLCWCLRPLLPPYPVTVGAVLQRPHGTTITILTDRVVKKIEDFTSNNKGVEYDDLANVYSATRRAAGLIHATDGPTLSESKGTYKVALAPLGIHRRPMNEGELRRAIQDVLCGVAALHNAGYVHRDIHWENVLCIGQDSWMLSDLESVARAPAQTADEGSFCAACWTDDTLDERGMYTTASDVQLVGRLMETCGILSLGAQCVELKAQLTASTAASRPSAVEALRHPWFAASSPP